MRCDSCGNRLRRNSSNGVVWWRCRHRLCKARAGIKEAEALAFAIEACVQAADELAKVAAAPIDESPQVAAKRRDLQQLQELARRNPALEVGVQALRNEIEGMTCRDVVLPDFAQYALAASDPGFWERATPEEQRTLLLEVLEAVRVKQGTDRPTVLARRL